MRIHSDILTPADLYKALRETGLEGEGVTVDFVTQHRSTKRARGLEFRLIAAPGRDRFGKARRPRNSGQWGSESFGGFADKGATYDEHGIWMAELYQMDPKAIIGPYKDRDDFHRQTRFLYAAGRTVTVPEGQVIA